MSRVLCRLCMICNTMLTVNAHRVSLLVAQKYPQKYTRAAKCTKISLYLNLQPVEPFSRILSMSFHRMTPPLFKHGRQIIMYAFGLSFGNNHISS